MIISQEGETSRGHHLAPILKTQTFPIYLLLSSCPYKYELWAKSFNPWACTLNIERFMFWFYKVNSMKQNFRLRTSNTKLCIKQLALGLENLKSSWMAPSALRLKQVFVLNCGKYLHSHTLATWALQLSHWESEKGKTKQFWDTCMKVWRRGIWDLFLFGRHLNPYHSEWPCEGTVGVLIRYKRESKLLGNNYY